MNDVASLYNNSVKPMVLSVAPVLSKTIAARPRQRWYNEELGDLKRAKRRAERKWLSRKTSSNKEAYSLAKRNYYCAVKNTRIDYYTEKLSECGGNLRSVYAIVNNLSGEKTETKLPTIFKDDTELANAFVEFFHNKVTQIRRAIEEELTNNDENSSTPSSFPENFTGPCMDSFKALNEEELTVIFGAMKKKRCSLDPIPSDTLSKCFYSMKPYILQIINKSLASGIFPTELKHSVIQPIIKNVDGDVNDLKNYRPVSNICFLSKLIEKCILIQLVSHFQQNNLMSNHQSGYKTLHSCETAMLLMVNDIQSFVEQRKVAAVLMLDLSAAFDTINHKILFDKLAGLYGIHGAVMDLLKSYLHGRTYSVIINGTKSGDKSLLCGVPQGSIIGPLLFILYIDDVTRMASKFNLKIHIYADDTTIYVGFNPINEVSSSIRNINLCMVEVRRWMLRNFMKLNVEKTQILFCGKPEILELHQSKLQLLEASLGLSQQREKHAKTLGVYIDENLTFDYMIDNVCRAGYYKLGVLRNMRNYLSKNLKIMLVKCYILSKIDYCNALYGCLKQCQIYKLQKLLNASIRFIFGIRRSASVTQYLIESHILPVNLRIKYKLCIMSFKILHGLCPVYLSSLLHRTQANLPGLRSSSDTTRMKTNYEEKTTAFKMCKVWNELPINLRETATLPRFKKDLKTHFFKLFIEGRY